MWESLGGWVENIFETGAGVYSTYVSGETSSEAIAAEAESESEKTQMLLYLGLGLLAFALVLRMRK